MGLRWCSSDSLELRQGGLLKSPAHREVAGLFERGKKVACYW